MDDIMTAESQMAMPNFYSGIATLGGTAVSVTAKSASRSLPKGKTPYLQTRFEKHNRRRDTVGRALEQVQTASQESQTKLEKLRMEAHDNEAKVKEREADLKSLKEQLKKVQEAYSQKQREVSTESDTIKVTKDEIAKLEQTHQSNEVEARRLEKEKKELDDADAKVARQAEILDIRPFEIAAMTKHAYKDTEFCEKLERVEQGTATATMKRYLKGEMFDKLTGITESEFERLAKDIMAARKKKYRSVAKSSNLHRAAPKVVSGTPKSASESNSVLKDRVPALQALIRSAERSYPLVIKASSTAGSNGSGTSEPPNVQDGVPDSTASQSVPAPIMETTREEPNQDS